MNNHEKAVYIVLLLPHQHLVLNTVIFHQMMMFRSKNLILTVRERRTNQLYLISVVVETVDMFLLSRITFPLNAPLIIMGNGCQIIVMMTEDVV